MQRFIIANLVMLLMGAGALVLLVSCGRPLPPPNGPLLTAAALPPPTYTPVSVPVQTPTVIPVPTVAAVPMVTSAPIIAPTPVPTPVAIPVPTDVPAFVLVGVPPTGTDCPADHPVKGNSVDRGDTAGDKIYHLPGTGSYAATEPELCFVDAG